MRFAARRHPAAAAPLALAFLLLWVALGAHLAPVDGCTVVLLGRNVTADGSVIIAHTDDSGSGTADLRLIKVPAAKHPRDSERAVYHIDGPYPRLVAHGRGEDYEPVGDQKPAEPAGYIPQVRHTYAYFDQDYGLMNEKQVAIAESTVGAKTVGWGNNLPYGYNMFGIAELTKVALERCDTARCAVQTMGDLAVKYGFYSEDSGDPAAPEYAFSAETCGVADKSEAWLFHVITGPNNASAVWAAVRVPDTHVAAIANGMVIRELDLEDGDNYLASSNVHSFAIEQGWWGPEQGPFDFTAAYAFDGDFAGNYPFYPLYVGRRVWRVLSLLAPSLELDPRLGFIPEAKTYPVTVPSDRRDLTPPDVMAILRDYYQGTPFDTSAGPKAGPFGAPVQYDPNTASQYPGHPGAQGGWERPISVFRQLFSFVCIMRDWLPDEVGGMFWYGHAQAHTTAYVPFYASATGPPVSYRHVRQTEFSTDASWWAFDFVSNWANLKYSHMIEDIRAEQAELEAAGREVQGRIETAALALMDTHGAEAAIDHLTTAVTRHAEHVTAAWWRLAWRLVAKYSDGYIARGPEAPTERAATGYPEPWLSEVGFGDWPGDTFLDPRAATHTADSQSKPGTVRKERGVSIRSKAIEESQTRSGAHNTV